MSKHATKAGPFVLSSSVDHPKFSPCGLAVGVGYNRDTGVGYTVADGVVYRDDTEMHVEGLFRREDEARSEPDVEDITGARRK